MKIGKPLQSSGLQKTPTVSFYDTVGSWFIGTRVGQPRDGNFPTTKWYDFKALDLGGENDGEAPSVTRKNASGEYEAVDIETGDMVSVSAPTMLNSLLSSVEDGKTVKITYKGLGKAKKGQRPARLFEVCPVEV